MLIYIRERYGQEEFDKFVSEYAGKTKNLPPVRDINRDSPEAYSVLYEKGSLILLEFENMIGKNKFFDFLKEVSDNKIIKTDDFLNLLEKKISKEARSWFENKLNT